MRLWAGALRCLRAPDGALAGTVLRLRHLLLVLLVLVALLVPAAGEDRFLIAAALALVVVPYNEALRRAADRTGHAPSVMGVADQLLCAVIVLVWPEVAAAVLIAGMLDVAVGAVLLPQRAAMAAAVAGAVLVPLPLLVLGLLGTAVLPSGFVFAAAAYVVSSVVTALTVSTVAGGERQLRRQLSAILESLPVVVYEMDTTTRQVRYVSPAITALTGQDPAALLGEPTPLLSRVHRRDLGSLLTLISDVSTSRETRELEYRIFAGDGQQRWVRNTASISAEPGGGATLRGCIADVTAQKVAEAALASQARTDPLTRLPNRLALLEALATPRRGGLLVFLDVDGFKRINDSLGHGAGDGLLVEVAERLTAAVRPGDVVARLGGDEFVVLSAGGSDALPGRLLEAFRAPFLLDGRAVHVSASAGAVPVGGAGPALRGEELLERADAAMYVAKRGGPGRAAWYDPSMRETAQERLELETELRAALERSEFQVLYQPVVRAGDHAVVAYEALVRWEHPERGTVAPDAFICVAEEAGLIVDIGREVLREACRQQARWAAGGAGPVVSVNLSARQLREPGLVDDVRAALDDAGALGSGLCLEITETALVDDPDRAHGTLEALRRLGVQIALDDFGTGFSSLSHLHRFPVDTVKVDRSFVAGVMDAASRDRGIVTAVLHLAAHMGFRVVAEGVEDLEQAHLLRDLGCDLLQGWAFGRPAPPLVSPLPGPRAALAPVVPLSR